MTAGSQTTDYTYNAADRLTMVNGLSSVVQYGYDADGRRVKQTIDSAVTNYLWDEASAYGDVVLETDGSGATLASYVLGDMGLISQSRSGGTSYYLQDGQGSTRALTNASGSITDTYSYTAFGELFNQTGSTTNNYLYTGQQFDALTGLYDLRARYYNPALGRFLSQDTYPVNFNNPVELNRYVYVANDPINAIDPSGQTKEENALILSTMGALSFALGGLGEAAYLYLARTGAIISTYLPPLLSLYSDQVFDLITMGQFGLQLVSNSPLASGWGSGGGDGGGDDGGNGGWDDLDFPEPGDPNGEGRHKGEIPPNNVGGIYEYRDLTRGGKWYVGSASKLSLFQRLSGEMREGRFASWDDVVWTKITLTRHGRGPILIAEMIRIEQVAEMEGGRQNLANEPTMNPAKVREVQLFFEDRAYENIPDWPDWLTINPYP